MHLGGGPTHLASRVSAISAALLYKQVSEHRIVMPDSGPDPTSDNPEKAIDEFLDRKELVVSKSMFIAISTTLPTFLAKSWLACFATPTGGPAAL